MAVVFARNVGPSVDLALLDVNVMIDTPQGLHIIPAEVFSGINGDLVTFIEHEAELILRHRANNLTRLRPFCGIDTLREQ
jgi:adenylate kinase